VPQKVRVGRVGSAFDRVVIILSSWAIAIKERRSNDNVPNNYAVGS